MTDMTKEWTDSQLRMRNAVKQNNLIQNVLGAFKPSSERGVSKQGVAAQAAALEHGVWKIVREGNLEELKQMAKEDEKGVLFTQRGAVGETILHVAYLYGGENHLKLADWLLEQRPTMIKDVYNGNEYHGENCLHIAIVKRQNELAKLIIKRDASLLNGRADGHFFSWRKPRKGERTQGTPYRCTQPCYYGEFPLAFAVCTSNKEIADYIIEQNPALLTNKDKNGNNLFHMTVIHTLPGMYLYVADKIKEYLTDSRVDRKVLEDLEKSPNDDKLTPLCLAAHLGNMEMFKFLLERGQTVEWMYGPVTCKMLHLAELDSVERNENIRGALEILVTEEHLDLLGLREIKQIVKKKWESFAKVHFFRRFLLTTIYLLFFTFTVIFRRKSDPASSWVDEEDDSHSISNATVAATVAALEAWNFTVPFKPQAISHHLETITETATFNFWFFVWDYLSLGIIVAGAYWKGSSELNEIRQSGLQSYFGTVGSGFLENFLSISFCICIAAKVLLHVLCMEEERIVEALACLFGWGYMSFFLLAFSHTGPFIVMIWEMLRSDVSRFFIILGLFLNGFALSFFVLFQQYGFGPFVSTVERLVEVMMGDVNPEHYFLGSFPVQVVALLLLLLFVVLVNVLLMNLLITMMGDTYNRISGIADQRWELEVARIILSIESEIGQSKAKDSTAPPPLLLMTTNYHLYRPKPEDDEEDES